MVAKVESTPKKSPIKFVWEEDEENHVFFLEVGSITFKKFQSGRRHISVEVCWGNLCMAVPGCRARSLDDPSIDEAVRKFLEGEREKMWRAIIAINEALNTG